MRNDDDVDSFTFPKAKITTILQTRHWREFSSEKNQNVDKISIECHSRLSHLWSNMIDKIYYQILTKGLSSTTQLRCSALTHFTRSELFWRNAYLCIWYRVRLIILSLILFEFAINDDKILSVEQIDILPWKRHQVETISALLALCTGNSLVTGEFPSKRPVTRSFDVFFDLRLNKRKS